MNHVGAAMPDHPLQYPVTVIAVCYNHARFLVECLDSIARQSFTGFQLIITDDSSSDGSADMIADWTAANRPDAIFIRHEKNVGLCATLNQALASAKGEYISMVSTDDVWEPGKLAHQLLAMQRAPQSVAVVYSDSIRIDETGTPLAGHFIQTHRPSLNPPSGDVFAALAEGNFIPAMSTLIRRSAIDAVGGYDERLTYEDYDMWLRLAARFDFAFCPGLVARYRIVETSMVRTLFNCPTPNHCYSLFVIHEKWLGSRRLTSVQRRKWAQNVWAAAHSLYSQGDVRARRALWIAFIRTRRLRPLLLALASSLGISRPGAKRIGAIFGIGE